MKIKAIYILLSCAFLTTGCVRNTLRDQIIQSYHTGNCSEANDKLTQVIQKELPSGNFTESKEAVWLLLDRGTIRFANGCIDDAIDDYQKAISAIDYYNQDATLDHVKDILISESAKPYPGEDFEQLLAPTYLACALLQKCDETNAAALLRYSINLENLKNEESRNNKFKKNFTPLNNLAGKYLLATLLERQKDLSNASILYRQCRIEPNEFKDSSKSTLLILLHNGNIPFKRSVRVSADIASLAFLEFFLGNTTGHSPALSSFTGVAVPQLVDWPDSAPLPISIHVGQHIKGPDLMYDLRDEALKHLEQNLPFIAAKNLARFLIRRAAVAVAEEQNPALGTVADFGMTIANLATQADTRSWSTLPARLDFFRFDLDPGIYHPLSSVAAFPSLNLKKGALCVINIFYLHPGYYRIQVPRQFIHA